MTDRAPQHHIWNDRMYNFVVLEPDPVLHSDVAIEVLITYGVRAYLLWIDNTPGAEGDEPF